jgi:hypothetical protein
MNIEAYKNQIIKKLLDVQDENLLAEMEAILDLNPIVIQTIDGKSLSKSEYMLLMVLKCLLLSKHGFQLYQKKQAR